jgi:hypothetical protein
VAAAANCRWPPAHFKAYDKLITRIRPGLSAANDEATKGLRGRCELRVTAAAKRARKSNKAHKSFINQGRCIHAMSRRAMKHGIAARSRLQRRHMHWIVPAPGPCSALCRSGLHEPSGIEAWCAQTAALCGQSLLPLDLPAGRHPHQQLMLTPRHLLRFDRPAAPKTSTNKLHVHYAGVAVTFQAVHGVLGPARPGLTTPGAGGALRVAARAGRSDHAAPR